MNHLTKSNAVVKDPVCGMTIDPATAVGSSLYNGERSFFCSRGCETKFDSAPETYSTADPTPATGSCCTTGHSCC